MKRNDVPLSEIMRSAFISLRMDDHLDFVDDVMKLGRIRHMPVLDGDRLVGIVSQRDLLAASLSKALEFEPSQRRTFMKAIEVKEAMSATVVSAEPDTPTREAARMMIRHKIGCLPVVDEQGVLVGLVTETDLIRAAFEVGSADAGDAAENGRAG